MFYYHLAPETLMGLSPELIDTLFAGLDWLGVIKLKGVVDETNMGKFASLGMKINESKA